MANLRVNYPQDNTSSTFSPLVTEVCCVDSNIPEYGSQKLYKINPKNYTPEFSIETVQAPSELHYWSIRDPVQLVDKPIITEIELGDNQRVRNFCRMFRYYRFDIYLRFDLRVPLGSNKVFKIVVLPGDTPDFSTEDNLILWPGVMVDTTISTTTFIEVPWMNKEYFYDFAVGEPSFLVIAIPVGETDIKTTPTPLTYTLSTYFTNIKFSAIRNVESVTPIPSDIDLNTEIALKALPGIPSTFYQDGEEYIDWKSVWKFIIQKTPAVAEVVLPGSGFLTKIISDFLLNVFNLNDLYEVGDLISLYIPLGSIVQVRKGENNFFIIDVWDKGDYETDKPKSYILCDGNDISDPKPLVWQEPRDQTTIPLSTRTIVNQNFLQNYISTMPTDIEIFSEAGGPIKQFWLDVNENPDKYPLGTIFVGDGVEDKIKFYMKSSTSWYAMVSGELKTIEYEVDLNLFGEDPKTTNWAIKIRDFTGNNSYIIPMFGAIFPSPDNSAINRQFGMTAKSLFIPRTTGPTWVTQGASFKVCCYIGKDIVEDETKFKAMYVFPCITQNSTGQTSINEMTFPIYFPAALSKFHSLYVPLSTTYYPNYTPSGAPLVQKWDMVVHPIETDASLIASESPFAGVFDEFNGKDVFFQDSKTLVSDVPKDIVGGRNPNPSKFVPKTLSRLSENLYIQQSDHKTGELMTEEVAGTSGPTMMGNNIMAPDVPTKAQYPIGETHVQVTAEKVWSLLGVQTLDEKKIYTKPLNPYHFNFAGALSPSHAQVEPIRHQWISANQNFEFCSFKITSVANAFANGRLIIAHIPPDIPPTEIENMSIAELSQFNRTEHVLHGPDSILDIKWQRRIPYMDAYSPDLKENNGYVVFRWVEYVVDAQTSSPPKISAWVNIDQCRYSVVRPPRVYKPLTYSEVGKDIKSVKSLQDFKTQMSIKINQFIDDDLSRLDLLDALDKL